MKALKWIASGMFALAAGMATASAGYLEEQKSDDATRILTDWKSGIIEVTGRGTSSYRGNTVQQELMAVEAARAVAQKKLAESLSGVRVFARTTVFDMVSAHQMVETTVDGMVQGAVPVSEKVTWIADSRDGYGRAPWAEVTLRLCMNRLAPECVPVQRTVYESFDFFRALPPATLVFGSEDAGRYLNASYEGYTGLVLDLGKLHYLPVLSPEVVTEDGKLVFAGRRVDPRILAQRGPVRYSDNLADAIASPLVGRNPIVVKVVDITADNKMVIDPRDAAVIFRASLEDEDFLALGKVVIVLQ